jgi:putative redox protein
MTTVTVRSREGYAQEIEARGHRFPADEPVEAGGSDTGPSPYELLLGALGACKSMTATMYARRKGWELQGVTVELAHDRDYRKDCEDCPDRGARIDRITVALTFEGNLDGEQQARLREIAARCPVHQTLTGTIEIVEAELAHLSEALAVPPPPPPAD